MKFTTVSTPLHRIKTDMLVIPIFRGEKIKGGPFRRFDDEIGGVISEAIASEGFTGKARESFVIFAPPGAKARRVVLAGLGKKKELSAEKIRMAAGAAGKAVSPGKDRNMALAARRFPELEPFDCARAFAEGLGLSTYKFLEHKTSNNKKPPLKNLTLVVEDKSAAANWRSGAEEGWIFVEATNYARDLCNHPSNVVTPTTLARKAREIAAKYRLKCSILSEADAKRLGMGAFLSVAKGSDEPAKFITLEYAPRGARQTVVLVGKGITFDSGGISLKPGAGMEAMKTDMAGAAAALASILGAARLKVDKRVIMLIAAAENMPGGHATKPGDIVKSMGGKTIEVINTEAEGRLVLIDALKYAERYQPDAVLDFATLTGACGVALGPYYSGLLGNNQKLIDTVKKAAEKAGDNLWQLPLSDDYRELMKSDVADLKNTSGARAGGTITAAAFLSEFTGKYAWAHIDIAPTAFIEKPWPYIGKGATGVPVRTVLNFLKYYEPPKRARART